VHGAAEGAAAATAGHGGAQETIVGWPAADRDESASGFVEDKTGKGGSARAGIHGGFRGRRQDTERYAIDRRVREELGCLRGGGGERREKQARSQ